MKVIGSSSFAIFCGAIVLSSCFGLIVTTPTQIMVPWEEGECMWLNGTIEDKEIRYDSSGGMNYFFLVNGTLDNETSFHAEVLGDRTDYLLVPIGFNYEGEICDSVSLRQAIWSGTVHFIDIVRN